MKAIELIEEVLSKHSNEAAGRIVESAIAGKKLTNKHEEHTRKYLNFIVEHHDFLWKYPDFPIIASAAMRLTAMVTNESMAASEGIYYIVKLKDSWKLFSHRFKEYGDYDHSMLWPYAIKAIAHSYFGSNSVKESVDASELAAKFKAYRAQKGLTMKLTPAEKVASDLKSCIYAFPRGRIADVGNGRYVVRNGNDWKRTGISKKEIEIEFGIVGKCTWAFDIHEQCMIEDRDKVRALLGIKETWPAERVKPSFD